MQETNIIFYVQLTEQITQAKIEAIFNNNDNEINDNEIVLSIDHVQN